MNLTKPRAAELITALQAFIDNEPVFYKSPWFNDKIEVNGSLPGITDAGFSYSIGVPELDLGIK